VIGEEEVTMVREEEPTMTREEEPTTTISTTSKSWSV